MNGYVPEDVIENIRANIDIVEVISEYIPLKRKGKNYTGCCPFHQENDPSFTVSPDKQIFYCFGCAVGGNVFKFLMLYEGFTFRETIEFLAKKIGISLPETGYKEKREKSQKYFASEVNLQAKDFFKNILMNWNEAAAARDYLSNRGVSLETIQHFELGYAPSSWDQLTKYLTQKGVNKDSLVNLGLAAAGKRGLYDRFRSRIMFPIRDAGGYVVGFGGRVLGEGQPKYLNTPETPVFNKSRILFGLYEERRSVMEAGYAVIMEGYMDVISARQHGVTNAVASLGTSLTREHIQLLMRYVKDVIIAYDADAAGVAATVRGLELMQEMGCRVRVISIPEGKDPDDYLQQYGIEGWYQLVNNADTLVEYKIKDIKLNSTNVIENKSAQLEHILPNLYNIQDEVEKNEAIKHVASRLYITWDAVAGELRRYQKQKGKIKPKSDKITKNKYNNIHDVQKIDARTKAEKILLKLMLENPQWVPYVKEKLTGDIFKSHVYNNIFSKALPDLDSNFSPAHLFNKLNEEEQKVLGDLLMEDLPGYDIDYLFSIYINALQKFIKKEHREGLMDILLEAEKNGEQKRVSEILAELKTLY
ncbi:MAG: DNA primase [Clostridiales bacterium]|nr:DNA primase [Clostridiales bacterium]